jgi:FdhD protein
VHGCALFEGEKMLLFVEDVGRHNAIDTIAGWMWLQDSAMPTHDKVFYTTGRLTSEMIIKSAQMGVPVVVSRSGITQMGHEVATRVGLCAIGRATNRHFVCYAGVDRLVRLPMPSAELDIDRPEDLLALDENAELKRRPAPDDGPGREQ